MFKDPYTMRKILLLTVIATMAIDASAQSLSTSTPTKYLLAVDEYCPAPGQFVNTMPTYEDGDNDTTMAQKCTDAIAGNASGMITLGGYGGYVTFHFDHSIANTPGQRDLYIKGNAHTGGAEPGIVMVSKDVNHNGKADDPWYEIAGSADRDSLEKMVFGYEITYTKDPLNDVPWTDNQGNSGTIDRNGSHTQEYFPLWKDSLLTFSGTLLPNNAWDKSGQGSYWVLNSYDYGYVDNKANSDTTACSFDIDWAVDPLTRDSVYLDYVDFVRVYNGMNQKAGWLGETSTEVGGAEDLHLDASVQAVKLHIDSVVDFEEIPLDSDSIMAMSEDTTSFTSKGFVFNYSYFPEWSYWSGTCVTGKKDTTFTDYRDQYNSCLGHGYAQSANYAIVYPQGETIDVAEGQKVISGFYVAANAWLQHAILEGDGMTEGAFTTGDWYRLDIIGLDGEEMKDTVSYYLADYRSDDEAEHYYVKDWTWIDLSALGEVSGITFRLSSSRYNNYGMTTPGYFLMDDFNGTYDQRSPKLTAIDKSSTTDGIRAIERQTNDDDALYNLSGQHVGKDYKGIVIRNGKKYIAR
jgi:hypothetical protein